MALTPEATKAWVEAFGGRRFLLTIGNAIVNTALLWCGRLDAGSYVTIVTLTTGAYIAAGTWQKGRDDRRNDHGGRDYGRDDDEDDSWTRRNPNRGRG